MSSPFPDKIADAVKSLGTEVKDAIDVLTKKLEGAVASLGEDIDRLSRMVRGSQAIVQLEAEAWTEFGESVLVVGNHASLGNWSPERGLILDSSGYPKWTARLDVPAGTTIEYKYVRKNSDGSFQWELIDGNRQLTAVSGPAYVARDQVRWG